MPDKWVRIWHERLPDVPLSLDQITAAAAGDVLLGRDADAGLVRLPVDRDVLSAIPLYTETTVVVVPKDHLVTAADEVSLDDLADDIVLHPLDDVLGWERPPGRPALERPATTGDAVELVAAGIGVLVVPLSLARLHHRKDLTHRPVTDAPGRAWPCPGRRTRTRTWSRSSSESSAAAPSTARGAAGPRNGRARSGAGTARRATTAARSAPGRRQADREVGRRPADFPGGARRASGAGAPRAAPGAAAPAAVPDRRKPRPPRRRS